MVAYIPDRGDIVHTNFSPQAGREQSGRRFGLIVSEKHFNKSGFAFICPITTKVKGYPMEVLIDSGEKTKGVVLPFHARIIDTKERGITFVEKAKKEMLTKCIEYIAKIMGLKDINRS